MAPTLAASSAALPAGKTTPAQQRSRGFTLIELLVAVGVMALLAVLSWRGLDSMTRAQTHTQQRADELLNLQAGLAQWSADLDAMVPFRQAGPIDWDGRALRLTRRSTASAGDGVLVVAWSRRNVDGMGQWLRWQSPPLRTRGELLEAWGRAALWAQNPGAEEKSREVAITPLAGWQIFFFRSDAWTNPLSSGNVVSGATPGTATAAAAAGATAGSPAAPDGVRLVLTLPPGQPLSGVLTRDWVQPTLGGGKS
ncbi:type II secretion system protein J [Polaromonas sp.]|jgi:general secretion pathway protein J|uniref:type II secretion system protein J n=1 Tax=Polaromonas sp. TaxID=1869339 RepID=UPI0037CA517E